MSYFTRWPLRKYSEDQPRGENGRWVDDSTNGGILESDKEGRTMTGTKWLTKIGDQAYRGMLGKYHVTIRKKRLYRSQQWLTYIGTSDKDRVQLLGSESMREAAEKALRYANDDEYRQANADRLVSTMRGG